MFTVNPVAEELGLVDAHGPGAVLAIAAGVPRHSHPSIDGYSDGSLQQDGNLNNGLTDPAPRPEAHFYSYLLDACEKLFEGELDQATFEENMRFLFGTKVRLVNKSLLYFYFFLLRFPSDIRTFRSCER